MYSQVTYFDIIKDLYSKTIVALGVIFTIGACTYYADVGSNVVGGGV